MIVEVVYARPNGQHQDQALAGEADVCDVAASLGLFVPASGTHGEAGISTKRQAIETDRSGLQRNSFAYRRAALHVMREWAWSGNETVAGARAFPVTSGPFG